MFGSSYQAPPLWRDHVCGLYYSIPIQGHLEKLYLPQVELQAHSTILATTSRTVLTQTFVNPSSTKGIKEVKYTFPLYDGVSVVGFTCHVGGRIIVGGVKEKEKARHDFNAAVSKGETAGLFEQLNTADIFQTTVGNVPPAARVVVKITYLGELKHDMEVDGIRFTIPNIIAPRYGRYPPAFYNSAQRAIVRGISITVDAEMAEGSFIQKILSPSHPIAISMGTTSSAPNAEPTMAKASATLSLGTAELGTDFIVQIVANGTGVPKAVLEIHPTMLNQRALMATLVPKFALPPEKPEIVFLCDRSGSMSGNNITLVRQALQVFLKSLPVGVMFNICSFGSSYSFLWPKSVAYSQETLDQAVRHVHTFAANYGGTEMIAPLKATIEQRYKDIPLEVMLLTDGAIWEQQALFTYLNEQITVTKAPIRVYSLGVGDGVSYSLIEGIAKAGNGFSQSVGAGEKMDAKVVRMLKGALSPHVSDYKLEVRYSNSKTKEQNDIDDDFEIVEKVADSLKVKLDFNEKNEKPVPKKPISLFDTSANPDKEEAPIPDETGESRYSHLPKLHVPNIIQAPQNIPTLFAFNRATVYLLLGPDAPQETPTSVILRGTSAHGPLELEFPVQALETPGEMIHQLAAKKAIAELEAGRGWLSEAKDESGKLIKEQYESRFSSMVEREAVRLGVQFQVSGKWCSFVAVEKIQEAIDDQSKDQEKEGWEWLEDEKIAPATPASDTTNKLFAQQGLASDAPPFSCAPTAHPNVPASGFGFGAAVPPQSISFSAQPTGFMVSGGGGGGLFGASTSSAAPSQPPQTGGLFGGGGSLFNSKASPTMPPTGGLFGGGGFSAFNQQQQQQNMAMAQQSAPQASMAFQQQQMQMAQQRTQQQQASIAPHQQIQMQQMQMAQQQQASAPQSPSLGPPGLSMAEKRMPPDYQEQLMLLEQQNKKRYLIAKREREQSTVALGLNFDDSSAALESFDFDSFLHQPQDMGADVEFGGTEMGRASPTSPSYSPCGVSSSSSPQQEGKTSSLFGAAKGGFGSASAFGAAPTASAFSGSSAFGAAPAMATFASTSAFGAPPAAPSTGAKPSSFFGSADASDTGNSRSTNPFSVPSPSPKSPEETFNLLIALQSFQGHWVWDASLFAALPVREQDAEKRRSEAGYRKTEWATALVVAYFEKRLGAERGSWELVVEKARGWLVGKLENEKEVEEMINKARNLV